MSEYLSFSTFTPSEQMECIFQLVEDLSFEFACYVASANESLKAVHLSGIKECISDLKTWHPGFDLGTGTLPWEREE